MERNELMRSALRAKEAGTLLKMKRQALGLTLEDVVARSDVPSRQYLHKLESGGVHPARSKYLASLVPVLSLSDGDWANLTGQPRMTTAVDVLHPHPLNAMAMLGNSVLPERAAYTLESDPGVIILDTSEAKKTLQAGKSYVVVPVAPVTSARLFFRARVVAQSDGDLRVLLNDHAYLAHEVRIIGRVLFEGHALDQ